MKHILVVGEDDLCCALGERLAKTVLSSNWDISVPINTRGVTNLWSRIRKYHEYAENRYPVLCVADTDNACVYEILNKRLPRPCSAHFLLRLAVTEAENWVLADQMGFARSFSVPSSKLNTLQNQNNSKSFLLALVEKSKDRTVRNNVTRKNRFGELIQGTGYNEYLCKFVRTDWNMHHAAQNSPSLERAIKRLKILDAQYLLPV